MEPQYDTHYCGFSLSIKLIKYKLITSNNVQLSLSQPVCHRNYEPGCVLISKPGAASQLQVLCWDNVHVNVAHGCEWDKQHLMIITASRHMGAIIDHVLNLSLTHIQYKNTYTHGSFQSCSQCNSRPSFPQVGAVCQSHWASEGLSGPIPEKKADWNWDW